MKTSELIRQQNFNSKLVSTTLFHRFDKHVVTTKRESLAEWGIVNPLYESKTLSGGDQQMDLPEERVDTDGNFEYRKILLLFEVLNVLKMLNTLNLLCGLATV